MYSLFIVDDERWVRQGLRTTIDWQAEGVEVLGEAEDGEEALMFMDNQVPDIIITDIKMPRMDGLAFIEAIKARQLPCKIIIISGYSEFSYAQKAMRFGVADYVLKPIEETQVLEVVRDCIAQLQRKHEEQDEIAQLSARMRESLPLARQQYVETLLLKQSASTQRNHKLWDQLHIQLHPDYLQVIIMKVYDWGPHAANVNEHFVLRQAIGNFAKAEIGQMSELPLLECPLDHNDDADLALLHSPVGEAIDKAALESFIQACRRYLSIGINVGMSRICDIAGLHAAFQEAIQASADALYDGYGNVYQAHDMRMTPPTAAAINRQGHLFASPLDWGNRFVLTVKLGDPAALEELLDELIAHMQLNRPYVSALRQREDLSALFGDIEKKLEASFPSELYTGKRSLFNPYCALTELKNELLHAVEQFRQSLQERGNRSRFVELAIDFTEQHFTEPLTMNQVADHLFLNPSYFSKLFHEKTGETFSKYLIRLRISKAKELLKQTTLKIYEVAEQVGYQDFRHFVKLFKEQEGMTPAQYRDVGKK